MTHMEIQAMQAQIRMAEEIKLIRETLQELTEELKRWRVTEYPPADPQEGR